ncbi:MAG: DUF1330 domain-containing protein [Phyllobacteriaceae bacterium]|nr:DUF1330 domain-containing protein [Phyllobacteriaceae bacterium]
MPAFVIADTRIENAAEYEAYKAKARAIAESYGGVYRARGGDLDVVDAQLWSPTRIVIIEFPDMASARAFARSPEYAPVAKLRHANAKSTVIIVDGM